MSDLNSVFYFVLIERKTLKNKQSTEVKTIPNTLLSYRKFLAPSFQIFSCKLFSARQVVVKF